MTGTRELRERLVSQLRASGALHDDRVAAALRAVPRHRFLPDVEPERAYRDDAIVTKYDAGDRAISSSSQPAIMALMLEQLGVEPGHRILEIGAGTGYNAALLACLAGEAGRVTTVDLDDDIAGGARAHLQACGFGQVSVVQADGWLGWPPDAPYDRIIATVGAWDIAPAWVSQLRPGGRIVLPLSLRPGMQYSVTFEQAGDHLKSVSICPCGFIRLRGAFAGPEMLIQAEAGVVAEAGPRPQDADPLPDLLRRPGEDLPAGIRIKPGDLFAGLGLWLAAREAAVGRLSTFGRPTAGSGAGPPGLVPEGEHGTSMLTSAHGCAVLVRATSGPPGEPFELAARPFGPEGPGLAARLVTLVRDWDAAGRPPLDGLRISAYPFGMKIPPAAGQTIIEKPETTLVLSWS